MAGFRRAVHPHLVRQLDQRDRLHDRARAWPRGNDWLYRDRQPAGNATTYVDAGLPNSTAYSYRLAAFNAAGKSGYSNTASGTTPPPVPSAPGAPSLDSGPAYVPPVVTVSATLTMQGATILAATVTANP